MPSFPWFVGDGGESNLSPRVVDSDSEVSYATVDEVRTPQWVQWFTTLSSRQNPRGQRPPSEPSQRSSDLLASSQAAPSAQSQSGLGSLHEEWSNEQVLWRGGEAPKLYSPWHQHVQANPISTYGVSSNMHRKQTGIQTRMSNWKTNSKADYLQHRLPTNAHASSQETLLPERTKEGSSHNPEVICLGIVTIFVFLMIVGTPLSLWVYFRYGVEDPSIGISAAMRITNWQYTDDLQSSNSDAYANYSSALCSELKSTFAFGGALAAIDTCSVLGFSNGSVWANFTIGKKVEETQNQNEMKGMLGQILSEAVTSGTVQGHKVMSGIDIDPSSLSFMEDDEDDCVMGSRLCAPHPCLDMLYDFMCQCNPGFLHSNSSHRQCIPVFIEKVPATETTTDTLIERTTNAVTTNEVITTAVTITSQCRAASISSEMQGSTLRVACRGNGPVWSLMWTTAQKRAVTTDNTQSIYVTSDSTIATLIINDLKTAEEELFYCFVHYRGHDSNFEHCFEPFDLKNYEYVTDASSVTDSTTAKEEDVEDESNEDNDSVKDNSDSSEDNEEAVTSGTTVTVEVDKDNSNGSESNEEAVTEETAVTVKNDSSDEGSDGGEDGSDEDEDNEGGNGNGGSNPRIVIVIDAPESKKPTTAGIREGVDGSSNDTSTDDQIE